MTKVYIVSKCTDYEGDDLLYVFSENIGLDRIKGYIESNDYQTENEYRKAVWVNDNRLDLNTFQRIEVDLVELDDWLFAE